MPTKLLTGLDILVVEDESLLRKQIAAHLESLGADVTGAGTLQAARQALADCGFDFALLDVNLPDGRGTSLLEEKTFSANTGVIVMTADGGVAGAVRFGAMSTSSSRMSPTSVAVFVFTRAVPPAVPFAKRTSSSAASFKKANDRSFTRSLIRGRAVCGMTGAARSVPFNAQAGSDVSSIVGGRIAPLKYDALTCFHCAISSRTSAASREAVNVSDSARRDSLTTACSIYHGRARVEAPFARDHVSGERRYRAAS